MRFRNRITESQYVDQAFYQFEYPALITRKIDTQNFRLISDQHQFFCKLVTRHCCELYVKVCSFAYVSIL